MPFSKRILITDKIKHQATPNLLIIGKTWLRGGILAATRPVVSSMRFSCSPFALLLAVLLLPACGSQHKEAKQEIKTVRAPAAPAFPIVQDTLRQASTARRATSGASTEHRFLYIGPYQDTVLLNHGLTTFLLPPTRQKRVSNPLLAFAWNHESTARSPQWPMAEHVPLQITVDTSQCIKAVQEYEWPRDTLSRWYDSYPVMLRNIRKDTLFVGAGEHVFLQLEAKDQHGQWRGIERSFIYACGNGLQSVFLPPQHIVLTSVFIPHGEVATELRLKLGRNYSPSFRGTINAHQFDNPYQ
ncbi:hypothetical protein [Hymenobacter cellulosilyticus]|uniref:Uncharacterized protein n=1 Tax=Hymenobacter cellulosilyticus TaxID=2932248 RepID=A0A8T9QGN0_9BACT|nr:hypothetical protein [Hymenobacter cellulosilyticus]UOQ74729.1 hypothetical protein MUN79_13135 [Hymenobacter cellulosilyticus]